MNKSKKESLVVDVSLHILSVSSQRATLSRNQSWLGIKCRNRNIPYFIFLSPSGPDLKTNLHKIPDFSRRYRKPGSQQAPSSCKVSSGSGSVRRNDRITKTARLCVDERGLTVRVESFVWWSGFTQRASGRTNHCHQQWDGPALWQPAKRFHGHI